MTDEELIARMRQVEWEPCQLAADRIEALLNKAVLSKGAYDGVSSLLLSVQQDCIMERRRAKRLEAALLWCSGSADFNEGGVAREGWLKVCAPLLKGAALPAVTQPAPDAAARRDAEEAEAYARELEAKLAKVEVLMSAGFAEYERRLSKVKEAFRRNMMQPAPDAASIREAVAKVRTKLADQDNATLLLGAEWALTMIEALTEKPHDRA